MKNKDDYKNGWTTPIINEKTGKKLSGGAARNHRIANNGGINNILVNTVSGVINSFTPLLNKQQKQIEQQNSHIVSLTNLVEESLNKSKKEK